jgi:hypothetical protein
MSRVARHTLTLSSAPAAEPVTTDEAKSWAKIDSEDDDALVGQLITAARLSAEEYLRRSLITQTWKLTRDLASSMLNNTLQEGVYDLPISALYGGLEREIELPKGPVQSITSVTTYALDNSASTYDSTNYFLDTAGARLVLNLGYIWPANMRPRAAAEILYVTGYGAAASAVPQAIRMAIMIHVASLYEQRGQAADEMSIPPAARQLLNQYRILGDRL